MAPYWEDSQKTNRETKPWPKWNSATTAEVSGPDISGRYRDDWGGTQYILEQSGSKFTCSNPDDGAQPEEGTVSGNSLEIWGLTGTFDDEKITWNNNSVWSRTELPAAQEATWSKSKPDPPSAAPDPWGDAASALDASGTYSDPWQKGEQTVFVQRGTRLTASGPDGSWGPEHGTVRGGRISIFKQEATFKNGTIEWDNGNKWERVSKEQPAAAEAPAEAAAAPTSGEPWQTAAESWQSQEPAVADTKATVDDASGTYSDPWTNDPPYVIKQEGTRLIAGPIDGSWPQEVGTIHGTSIDLFKQKAELLKDGIRWENGNTWPRISEASEMPAASPAGPADAAAGTWYNAADAWNPQGAAPADVGAGPTSDAQKRAMRWKDLTTYQDYYKANNVLPGKSDQEITEDEERLFKEGGRGAGIDFDLYDTVSCDITGPKSENIPQLKSFEALFQEFADYLPAMLVENIRRCGYERPTPVQKFSIPAALSGRDIMCCAQTGSGKTAAFLVPILASMIKHGKATGDLNVPFEGPCKPDTVVICPTRELCLQIYEEATKFCHKTPHRCVRIYGAEPVKTQMPEVAHGADLVVSTPGRLWDFVSTGIIEVTDVQCLVLDEADRMLAMDGNNETFLRDVVEKYGMPAKEERQTLLFSATFPEGTQKLAADYLYEHIFIGVGVVGGAACTVTQKLVRVAPQDKFEELHDFLNNWLANRNAATDRLMVFTNSKIQAKGLDEQLYERNIDTGALHGDLSQPERETNLQRFRNGEIDVLVATDLASRGLDIDSVTHVVNYDLPFETEVYVQRIGRTGRIGNRGQATTFIAVDSDGKWTDDERVLRALPGIMQDDAAGCHNEVPRWLSEHLDEMQTGSWADAYSGGKDTTTDIRDWNQDRWQNYSSGN